MTDQITNNVQQQASQQGAEVIATSALCAAKDAVNVRELGESQHPDVCAREFQLDPIKISDQRLTVEPLVAAHINLAKFPWAPARIGFFDSHRLLLVEDAEPFRALIVLIAKSWKEQPAGTLPDDNRKLAALAGFGRDVGAWDKVREEVLADWVLASDGRWHHAEVATWVLQAWESKQKAEAFSEQQRLRAQAGAAKRRMNPSVVETAYPENQSNDPGEIQGIGRGSAGAQPKREKENKKNKDKNKKKEIKREGGKDDLEVHPSIANTALSSTLNSKGGQEVTLEGNGVDHVEEVFRYWKSRTNRPSSPLTSDRRKIIEDRLGEGISVEIMCRAIDGASIDDFYQGRTSKQLSRIDMPDVIFKSYDRVERLASLDPRKKPLNARHGFSDAAQATAHAFMRALETSHSQDAPALQKTISKSNQRENE